MTPSMQGISSKGNAMTTEQEPQNLLAAFDAAINAELPRVSHVEYDSHEICKHFAGEVRKRLKSIHPAPAPMPDAVRSLQAALIGEQVRAEQAERQVVQLLALPMPSLASSIPLFQLIELAHNFEITGPDADGLVWLALHGNGTTGKAIFNLGQANYFAVKVALLFEADRRAAIAATKRTAPAAQLELPSFDDLPEDAIDSACEAGGFSGVEFMSAWDALRAAIAAKKEGA